MTNSEKDALTGKLEATKALLNMVKNLRSVAENFAKLDLLSIADFKSINDDGYKIFMLLSKRESDQYKELRRI